MSRLPKYIRRESGVVYELFATIPPKKFIQKGEYVYRLEGKASVKTAENEAQIQKGSGKIYVQFYDENGYVGREQAWSMEEAEDLVREWESGEGGGGSMPDLEKHYDYPSHQRDPYEYASSEETTGHQGEKGEGTAECKAWCDTYYDRPCNCEEGKVDDRYNKYYANSIDIVNELLEEENY